MLAILNQWGLTAAIFVVAAVYVPGLFSAGNMPHWWAAAVLVPMVSWLDPRRVPLEIGLLLLAGLSWAALSLAWTPIPAEGFGELILLVVLALVFLAAAGEERTDRLMVAACLGVSVSSVFSLLQWCGVEMNIPRAGNAGLFMNQEVLERQEFRHEGRGLVQGRPGRSHGDPATDLRIADRHRRSRPRRPVSTVEGPPEDRQGLLRSLPDHSCRSGPGRPRHLQGLYCCHQDGAVGSRADVPDSSWQGPWLLASGLPGSDGGVRPQRPSPACRRAWPRLRLPPGHSCSHPVQGSR